MQEKKEETKKNNSEIKQNIVETTQKTTVKPNIQDLINTLLDPNDFCWKRFGLDKKIMGIRDELLQCTKNKK